MTQAAFDPTARVLCPHAERCGGCTLIALPYGAQLEHKRERLARALGLYPSLAPLAPSEVVAASPISRYRTRAKLVVGGNGELGLYARGSHQVVDIPECQVLRPIVASTVATLRGLCRGVAGLSAIDVRELLHGDGGASALVSFVGDIDAAQKQELAARIGALEHVASVAFAAPSAAGSPRVLGGAPAVAYGPSSFVDRLGEGEPYSRVTHGSFVQAHRGQALTIARAIKGALEAASGNQVAQAVSTSQTRVARNHERHVLELYGGSGFLALALARSGIHVTLVEGHAPATQALSEAAREQGLSSLLTVIAGDAARAVGGLQGSARKPLEAAIVNPPRRGIDARTRTAIARLAPALCAYVSCEPATLARDLAALAQLGLIARELRAFDMIPQSAEVETLALLAPGAPPRLAVLYEDEELLVLDKPPHVPTTPSGEHPPFVDARGELHATSLLERARREHALSERAAAVHRLDAGTSGACLIAKHARSVAAWAAALKNGQKRYLALARGITHEKGTVRRPLPERGRSLAATTRYRRQKVLAGHSLLELAPEQGRTHQIRRHLGQIGHPVLGDARYGHRPSNAHFEHAFGLDRCFLHLERLELEHPRTHQPLVLESPLASDLEALLGKLA